MGSLGDELSLGSGFQVSKMMNVAEHIKKLEEEKRKIQDHHKLELPLCLEILNNAISCLKEENKKCLVNDDTKPLLKDFISLDKTIGEEDDEVIKEKKFQQWKANDHILNQRFLERNEEKSSMLLIPTPKVETGLGLGLASSSIRRKDIASSSFTSMAQPPAFLQQQALRKQRRCWTPELHRRFVDALQQLGGPGVATPKQIREHMQEEGLTNDEVKSHLQKYRLHIRRPNNSNPEKQSVVVLGFKLWNSSQEEEGESSSKRSDSQSDSPQGPLQLPLSTTTTTTGGDSSMEDGEYTKSESFKIERD
ncbi:hypothetical protein AALP_AA4G064900 [Arabis alpina]|uniref:HTH myb-type domain-containing protein n=1 Tax=Arabis alpina TaxID=50452 RepID=A0A087H1J9_ARAAL|nr:hypothetical protein AALP_AA4G064900 [Arabis alpina]